MNLHLIPNNNFLNIFIEHSDIICNENSNKFIVVLPRFARIKNNQKKINKSIPYVAFASEEFRKVIGNIDQYNAVFIHYLSPDLAKWVVKNERYRGKFIWGFWGADFFSPFRLFSKYIYDIESEKYQKKIGTYTTTSNPLVNIIKKVKYNLLDSFISRRTEKTKSRALSRINYILHYNALDVELIRAIYPNFKATLLNFYYLDYDFDTINITSEEQYQSSKKQFNLNTQYVIQLGHNSSLSNNHITALKKLNKDLDNVTVIIPLSYGDKRYTQFVKALANKVLGESSKPIETYMSKEQYMHLLQTVDVGIMNHIRAEAGSNIVLLLAMGKVVYMNPSNNLYQFFIANGIHIGVIDQQSINLSALVSPIPISIVKSNSDKIKELFSTNKAFEQTKLIYNTINQDK